METRNERKKKKGRKYGIRSNFFTNTIIYM